MTTGAAPADTRQSPGRPLHAEFLPDGERTPARQHRIQGRSGGSRGAHAPRGYMAVHDVLGGRERLVMHPDDLPARFRAPAAHAFERGAVGEQTPEAMVEPEG